MRRSLLAASLALTACGLNDPVPAPEGVSPLASAPVVATTPEPTVLQAPPELPDEAPPVVLAPVAGPAPKTVFEIQPLGRFEVITWAEAERQAVAKIGPDNFQSELNRLRADILGRRR